MGGTLSPRPACTAPTTPPTQRPLQRAASPGFPSVSSARGFREFVRDQHSEKCSSADLRPNLHPVAQPIGKPLHDGEAEAHALLGSALSIDFIFPMKGIEDPLLRLEHDPR